MHANENDSKKIFFLLVVVCLFSILSPGFAKRQHEVTEPEYGIGGGMALEEMFFVSDIYEENIGFSDSLESIEFVGHEPESIMGTPTLFYDRHVLSRGDNISTLAVTYGLHQGTLISVNKITNSRGIWAGNVLRIPNQDGILHAVKADDTLESIAASHSVEVDAIRKANELFSDNIRAGTDLFIPGARLDWNVIQEINGDLFIWPVRGAITSNFGNRRSPFTGARQFHNGIDIRASTGTPIRAAMAGRVSAAGWDNVFGNYVIINHHSGYRTLYGHMSVIRTRVGANVAQGQVIGSVGSTGVSTGPHLHFTVFRNGVAVNPRLYIR